MLRARRALREWRFCANDSNTVSIKIADPVPDKVANCILYLDGHALCDVGAVRLALVEPTSILFRVPDSFDESDRVPDLERHLEICIRIPNGPGEPDQISDPEHDHYDSVAFADHASRLHDSLFHVLRLDPAESLRDGRRGPLWRRRRGRLLRRGRQRRDGQRHILCRRAHERAGVRGRRR